MAMCIQDLQIHLSDASPQKGTGNDQVQNGIQVFSTQCYWSAVASYDQLFRQYLCDFPERSWARTDTDLFIAKLAPNRLPISTGQGRFTPCRDGKKFTKGVCNAFNCSNCTWGKRCRFDHWCEVCNKIGHSKLVCRNIKRQDDQANEAEKE